MKTKINILVVLSIILCSGSCKIFVEYAYLMRIHNNTNDTIFVCAGYNYPDTTLSSKKPSLLMVYPNTRNGGLDSETHWADKVDNDTLSIFVFNKDTVDAYDWAQIRDDYKIIKRYDLSISELDEMSWTIKYP